MPRLPFPSSFPTSSPREFQFTGTELYCRIADCRTETPATFRGPFSAFRGHSKRVFIYSTITRRTPDYVLRVCGVPRSPGWKKHWFIVSLKAPTDCSTQAGGCNALEVCTLHRGLHWMVKSNSQLHIFQGNGSKIASRLRYIPPPLPSRSPPEDSRDCRTSQFPSVQAERFTHNTSKQATTHLFLSDSKSCDAI